MKETKTLRGFTRRRNFTLSSLQPSPIGYRFTSICQQVGLLNNRLGKLFEKMAKHERFDIRD